MDLAAERRVRYPRSDRASRRRERSQASSQIVGDTEAVPAFQHVAQQALQHSFQLGQRSLSWSEFGDKAGEPLLYFHASGSSRLEASLFHEPARRAGLRLIAVDRPGVGGSSFNYATTADVFASDLLALLDHLAIERVGLLTLGTGAVYALALAKLAPLRISRQLSLGDVPSGPLLAKQTGGSRLSTAVSSAVNSVLHAVFAHSVRCAWRLQYRLSVIGGVCRITSMKRVLGAVDQRVLENQALGAFLQLDYAEAMRQGGRALAQDESIGVALGDYALEKLNLPVEFWQGEGYRDRQGRVALLLAQRLPQARQRTLARQGYFFFLDHGAELLSRFHGSSQPPD